MTLASWANGINLIREQENDEAAENLPLLYSIILYAIHSLPVYLIILNAEVVWKEWLKFRWWCYGVNETLCLVNSLTFTDGNGIIFSKFVWLPEFPQIVSW